MAAGDILLDASGNVILAAGDVMLSDGAGDYCCCGTLPELLLCPSSTNSGIGLLPEHNPGGTHVKYNGNCYEIGPSASGLTPTTHNATSIANCADAACTDCTHCTDTPETIEVTFGISVCDCADNSGVKVIGTLGTYSVPRIGTCQWELTTTGPTVEIHGGPGSHCLGAPVSTYDQLKITITRTAGTWSVEAHLLDTFTLSPVGLFFSGTLSPAPGCMTAASVSGIAATACNVNDGSYNWVSSGGGIADLSPR